MRMKWSVLIGFLGSLVPECNAMLSNTIEFKLYSYWNAGDMHTIVFYERVHRGVPFQLLSQDTLQQPFEDNFHLPYLPRVGSLSMNRQLNYPSHCHNQPRSYNQRLSCICMRQDVYTPVYVMRACTQSPTLSYISGIYCRTNNFMYYWLLRACTQSPTLSYISGIYCRTNNFMYYWLSFVCMFFCVHDFVSFDSVGHLSSTAWHICDYSFSTP